MTAQLAIDFAAEAKRAAEDGMERAASRAERTTPGWRDEALALLVRFAALDAGGPFLGEEARAFAYTSGLPKPPDERAWGAIFNAAARRGLIARAGFAPATSSHGSPKPLWRRAAA